MKELYLVETSDLIDELIVRSDGCIIGYIEKGSTGRATMRFGGASFFELAGMSVVLSDGIINALYDEEDDDEL